MKKILILAASFVLIGIGGLAHADEGNDGAKVPGNKGAHKDGEHSHGKGWEHKELTKEQRIAMAVNLEKMAVCLRSEKPMEDCHKEMMDSCKANKNACWMHGHEHGHWHGHHHHDDDDEDENEGQNSTHRPRNMDEKDVGDGRDK